MVFVICCHIVFRCLHVWFAMVSFRLSPDGRNDAPATFRMTTSAKRRQRRHKSSAVRSHLVVGHMPTPSRTAQHLPGDGTEQGRPEGCWHSYEVASSETSETQSLAPAVAACIAATKTQPSRGQGLEHGRPEGCWHSYEVVCSDISEAQSETVVAAGVAAMKAQHSHARGTEHCRPESCWHSREVAGSETSDAMSLEPVFADATATSPCAGHSDSRAGASKGFGNTAKIRRGNSTVLGPRSGSPTTGSAQQNFVSFGMDAAAEPSPGAGTIHSSKGRGNTTRRTGLEIGGGPRAGSPTTIASPASAEVRSTRFDFFSTSVHTLQQSIVEGGSWTDLQARRAARFK